MPSDNPAVEIAIADSPKYHCECKEKKWPPGPFPYCACPECRPQSAPPVLMTGPFGGPYWSNTDLAWDCSATHRKSRKECCCRNCSAEKEETAGGTGSVESCFSEKDCPCRRRKKSSKRRRKKSSNAGDNFHCGRSCCCPLSKPDAKFACCAGACPTAGSHRCAYKFHHSSGGGLGAGGCISGFHDGCLAHYCTDSPDTCWYCKQKKDEEDDDEAKKKKERAKRCHCHLCTGCPGGLPLVGRHHCMTCLECTIDREE